MHSLETIDRLNAAAVARDPGKYRVIEKSGVNIRKVHSFDDAQRAHSLFNTLNASLLYGDSVALVSPA